MNDLKNISVLIDADNTQISKLEAIIREISTYGRIVVKRAYGNWKKDTLKNWEDELKRLAIKAEQQFDYVAGKNATDMALVIDTIELFHRAIYDAFVIISSDSDYTPLAIKLHESGVYVMGVGEKKTPEAFRNACDEFIFLENISNDMDDNTVSENVENIEDLHNGSDKSIDEIHKLFKIAFDTYQEDDGFVNVSSAGSYIKRTKPDFDVRSYGHLKLPQFLDAFPERYEVKRYKGKGKVNIVAYKCI